MLKGILGRVLAIGAMTLGGVAVVASPAFAAGGGCTSHPDTEPCISRSGTTLLGDFYQMRTPDSSMYYYLFQIVSNGSVCFNTTRQRLTTSGHHSASNWKCASSGSGSAHSVIYVYNSAGALHYQVTSPTVTW